VSRPDERLTHAAVVRAHIMSVFPHLLLLLLPPPPPLRRRLVTCVGAAAY
jgi:hypothetical protein